MDTPRITGHLLAAPGTTMTGIARVRRPDWHDVLPLLLVALVALAFVLLLVGVVKNDTHLAGAPAPQTTHQLTGDALRAL